MNLPPSWSFPPVITYADGPNCSHIIVSCDGNIIVIIALVFHDNSFHPVFTAQLYIAISIAIAQGNDGIILSTTRPLPSFGLGGPTAGGVRTSHAMRMHCGEVCRAIILDVVQKTRGNDRFTSYEITRKNKF
jgi:hypothetical protein